jgi:hypothetical protein
MEEVLGSPQSPEGPMRAACWDFATRAVIRRWLRDPIIRVRDVPGMRMTIGTSSRISGAAGEGDQVPTSFDSHGAADRCDMGVGIPESVRDWRRHWAKGLHSHALGKARLGFMESCRR